MGRDRDVGIYAESDKVGLAHTTHDTRHPSLQTQVPSLSPPSLSLPLSLALSRPRRVPAVPGGRDPGEERGRRGHHVHPELPGASGPGGEEGQPEAEDEPGLDLGRWASALTSIAPEAD